MNETISVIIPIHNQEKYLSRCLDSVIKNTYNNLEIICVDDGSIDMSLDILREYQNKDDRFVVVVQKCMGVSCARNTGLKKATGNYIAFIDSDDWIHERYFEYLYKSMKEQDADIAICDYILARDSSTLPKDIINQSQTLTTEELYASNKRFYVWRKLYKREVLNNIWFDKNQKIEDVIFNTDTIINNKSLKFSVIDIPLYAYYQRGDSLISTIFYRDRILVSQAILDRCKNEFRKTVKSALAEDAIKRTLSARFFCQVLNEKENVILANKVLYTGMRYLKKNKLRYFMLVRFSFLYTMFRIKQDRSLLDWIKQQREK